jgi:hypothetical protein
MFGLQVTELLEIWPEQVTHGKGSGEQASMPFCSAARHFADFDFSFFTAAAHAVLAHTRLDAGSSGQAQGAAAVREQPIQASAIARATSTW